MKALDRAIKFCGSKSALARELDVSHVTVLQWEQERYRIPPERAKQVEQITGGLVRREKLRPDVFGD